MTDPIESAIKVAKTNASNIQTDKIPSSVINPVNTARNLTSGSAAVIDVAMTTLPPGLAAQKAKLEKLPISKDPELAKKQAEAELQKKKGELTNKLQQEKNSKIEDLKNKAAQVLPVALGIASGFLKKPVIDPKIIATISFLKELKQTREKKQSESKENLKKAKETFTFPMKPVNKPETTPTASVSVTPSPPLPTIKPSPSPTGTITPTPTPTPSRSEIPPGISPEDWKRFGTGFTRLFYTPEEDASVVKAALQRKAARRAEIIRIQEERVARGKRFVDFQSERWGKAPDDLSVKAAYDNALKVYFQQRKYLEKVKNDPNILDLTE